MSKYFYPPWQTQKVQALTLLRSASITELALPTAPKFLTQVHGNKVVDADSISSHEGDAWVGRRPGQVLAIKTADCLPVFFTSKTEDKIAIAHAGWRGIALDILQATVKALQVPPQEIRVAFGPAIGPLVFEVGQEVITACNMAAKDWYKVHNDKYLVDIYKLATYKLNALGVTDITSCSACTYSNPELYYSYRRDKENPGRMQSLIWLNP